MVSALKKVPSPSANGLQELKIGLVGCGYWGPKLARNFVQLPHSRLAMACDLHKKPLQAIQDLSPETAVTHRYQDLLDADLTAIVIATPIYTHYKLAKAALLAGKHVLVEKPITANSNEALELIHLAEERNLVLMVGHTFVYNPAVEAVRQIVQSGDLGNIYYLDAVRVNLGLLQPDINVMWDLGPHDISMIQYILGENPVKVSARGAVYINSPKNLHEVVYMVITFANGVIANLRLSWLDPVKQRRLTAVGSKKMLVYDDIAENKVIIYDKGVEVPPYTVTEDEFRASYRHGDETIYPLSWEEPLQIECRHFLEAIQTGKRPKSDGHNGLQILRVLETAQRSLLNGGVELLIEY